MTIPTRDEALKALDKISSDYDLAGGWSPDPMPLLATLRSYIESHTGEPVAWITVETDGKVRTTHKKATADMWRAISGSKVSPLFASPVQPDHIADVGKMICPRSANGRPESFTVRDCVAAGECGCGESVTPGSTVRASPVQPVKLEWKDDRLIFNGLLIGQVSESVYYPGVGFGYTFVKTPLTFAPTGPKWSKEEARAALEATARQWLSGGDK